MTTTLNPWQRFSYMSGTTVVLRIGGPYYHVGHLAADTEGDAGRHDVARELESWLNGGDEPWWLDLVKRTSARSVQLPHGCEIQATGPMIDAATPPQWGDWREDDRPDAQLDRGLLIEALINRTRPA